MSICNLSTTQIVFLELFGIPLLQLWVDVKTYKKFLRMLEEDEPSYGNFGCPFLEYNEENIGIHYAYEKEDN